MNTPLGILSRRRMLESLGHGFGGIALGALLDQENSIAEQEIGSRANLDRLHHKPKAKRVVQLFMAGAASHIDLFDYKPGA